MSKNNHSCLCSEQVKALEKSVEKLSAALSHHLENAPTLLWGWENITAYALMTRRTLLRYTSRYGFPVVRVGQHVVSSPTLIDSWLIARKQQQRARKGQPTYMGEYWRTHPRSSEVSAVKSPEIDGA
jgi:hypothetical protein